MVDFMNETLDSLPPSVVFILETPTHCVLICEMKLNIFLEDLNDLTFTILDTNIFLVTILDIVFNSTTVNTLDMIPNTLTILDTEV